MMTSTSCFPTKRRLKHTSRSNWLCETLTQTYINKGCTFSWMCSLFLFLLLSLFRFRLWQLLTSGFDKFRQIRMVVYVVDEEIIFCPIVWRTKCDLLEQLQPRLCRLQIKLIIANQSENLSVAIDAILPEHFFRYDFASISALVCDVSYKVCVACHRVCK